MNEYYNGYEKIFEFLRLKNTERLLLKASIQEKPQGTTLINQWQREVDLDTLAACSIELFPFLYFKYKQELNKQFTNLFLGTYRKSFYKNNIILKETCRLLDLLKVNDIPCICFKGIPLALRYYKNLAIRPMNDSDIIVRPQDFQKAVEIALKNGFSDNKNMKSIKNTTQMHLYNNELGVICDLHRDIWQAKGVSYFLWDSVEKYYLSPAVSFPVPSAAGELILAFTRGIFGSTYRACRWIIDAYMIIKSEPAISWEMFIAYAQKSHLRIHLLRTLYYLKTNFDIPIPEKYYQKLAVDYPWVEDMKCFIRLSVEVEPKDYTIRNYFSRLIAFLSKVRRQCQIFKILYGNHPKKISFYALRVLFLLELIYTKSKDGLSRLFAKIKR